MKAMILFLIFLHGFCNTIKWKVWGLDCSTLVLSFFSDSIAEIEILDHNYLSISCLHLMVLSMYLEHVSGTQRSVVWFLSQQCQALVLNTSHLIPGKASVFHLRDGVLFHFYSIWNHTEIRPCMASALGSITK